MVSNRNRFGLAISVATTLHVVESSKCHKRHVIHSLSSSASCIQSVILCVLYTLTLIELATTKLNYNYNYKLSRRTGGGRGPCELLELLVIWRSYLPRQASHKNSSQQLFSLFCPVCWLNELDRFNIRSHR